MTTRLISLTLLATLVLAGQSYKIEPRIYTYKGAAILVDSGIIQETATTFMGRGCAVVTVTTRQKILELRPKNETEFDMKAFPPDGPKEIVIKCESYEPSPEEEMK